MPDLSPFDLTGRVAIVTGGNGGLGRGMALGLARAGASIVVAARNPEKTALAVRDIQALGVRALGLPCDVTDEAQVQAAVARTLETFGRVDVLVANAGIGIRKRPEEYTLAEWRQVVETHLTGTYLCCRAVYPPMKAQGYGKIVTIGSMTSVFGSDWVAPYSAAKGGEVQLTRSLAVAWAADGVRVNCILPGWFHTDLTAAIPRLDPPRYQLITQRIPLGRWGQPEDLAGTAVFLAAPASDYLTGAVIAVDGGYTSK